jgi:hypothetical protein
MKGQTTRVSLIAQNLKYSIENDIADIRPKSLFSMTDHVLSPQKQEEGTFEIYQDPI